MNRHAPRLRIRFRIVDGDFHIHVTEVMAAETFDRVIGIAMGMPAVIEVGLIVETDRIHDEAVAVEGGKWEIYIGGAAGAHVRKGDILCVVDTHDDVLKYSARFVQYQIPIQPCCHGWHLI